MELKSFQCGSWASACSTTASTCCLSWLFSCKSNSPTSRSSKDASAMGNNFTFFVLHQNSNAFLHCLKPFQTNSLLTFPTSCFLILPSSSTIFFFMASFQATKVPRLKLCQSRQPSLDLQAVNQQASVPSCKIEVVARKVYEVVTQSSIQRLLLANSVPAPGSFSPTVPDKHEFRDQKQTRWSPRTRMQTRSKSYICPNDTLVGHSCGTLFWDTLVGHSYTTLLWDTPCGTLLWDTLVGHSCGTLLWDTLVGHSCRTLLWDTLVGNSCGTLLQDTLVGHSYGTLF